MKNLILFFICLFLASHSFAQNSMEWQKINLEEKITDKIKSSLQGVVEDGKYLVEVQVELNDPGPPNFNDINKTGLKVSDVEFDESKGDYIAFSKVGLEVPVVEKYYQEHQQKLKELHKFNETYNIFKNLKAVKIDVVLSDLIPEEVFQNVQNTVNKLKLPTGQVRAEIKFEKLKMEYVKPTPPEEKKEEPKIPEMTLKDWILWLGRFANAFGLILATILFGWLGLKMLAKWHEYMTNLKAIANKNVEELTQEMKAEDDKQNAEAENEAQVELLEATAEENFQRFRKFFENSKLETILMVKRWINTQDENADIVLALKGVAQQLSDENLADIFSGLNDIERESWKNQLNEFLTVEEISTANKFISEEVMRQMVGPSRIKDIELVDLLLGLKTDIACRFVVESTDSAKILMNLLTPQFSSKILDQLTPDQVEGVLLNSLNFDFDQVKDGFKAFKTELLTFIENAGGKRKPFNDKILQMLPNFNPSKEKMLYQFLARDGMKAEMFKIAKTCFPSDLIMDLPRDFIKTMMQNYPMSKKVQLMGSFDENTRQNFLGTFAEKGSAAREMFDLEFENILGDSNAISRLQSRHDEIWKEFVQYSRSMIKVDTEFTSQVDLLINDWINQMVMREKTQSNVNHLRQVA